MYVFISNNATKSYTKSRYPVNALLISGSILANLLKSSSLIISVSLFLSKSVNHFSALNSGVSSSGGNAAIGPIILYVALMTGSMSLYVSFPFYYSHKSQTPMLFLFSASTTCNAKSQDEFSEIYEIRVVLIKLKK